MNLNTDTLAAYVARASSARTMKIRYRLGEGGFNPKSKSPASLFGYCDCTGFVSWVIGLSRKPKKGRRWWISTSDIVRDACGPEKVFVRLSRPIKGCIAVYGDSGGHEGHAAIVTRVYPTGSIFVVDCSKSRNGVVERSGRMFTDNKNTIYCTLAQNVVSE